MKSARKTRKNTTSSRSRAAGRPRPPAGGAGARIREAWREVSATVAAAQADLESQVRQLLRRQGISTKDGATLLADVRALAERERKRAARELKARFRELRSRIEKERRGAARGLDEAVARALAALDIPSRSEMAALAKKVDELNQKIGRLKR